MTILDPTQFYQHRDELVELLVFKRLGYAARALKNVRPNDPTGVSQALLGRGHFLSEQYDWAEVWYGDAFGLDAGNQDWKLMLELAKANHGAAINVPVPPEFYFKPMICWCLPSFPPTTCRRRRLRHRP